MDSKFQGSRLGFFLLNIWGGWSTFELMTATDLFLKYKCMWIVSFWIFRVEEEGELACRRKYKFKMWESWAKTVLHLCPEQRALRRSETALTENWRGHGWRTGKSYILRAPRNLSVFIMSAASRRSSSSQVFQMYTGWEALSPFCWRRINFLRNVKAAWNYRIRNVLSIFCVTHILRRLLPFSCWSE